MVVTGDHELSCDAVMQIRADPKTQEDETNEYLKEQFYSVRRVWG